MEHRKLDLQINEKFDQNVLNSQIKIFRHLLKYKIVLPV